MRSAEEQRIHLRVNGRRIAARAGSTVAATLLGAGVNAFRTSVSGSPRAPLCGMGICFECRVTVQGVAHQRACMIEVTEGMEIRTDD